MVGVCSSIIIPIILLNFFHKQEETGEGNRKREDVKSHQEENPTKPQTSLTVVTLYMQKSTYNV